MKTRSKSKSSKKVHQNHHKPLKKMKSVKKQKPQKKNKVKSLKKKKKHFHKKSKRRNRKKKGGMPGKKKRDDENAEEENNQKKPNLGSCIICEENYNTTEKAMQTISCCGNNICKECTIKICKSPYSWCPFCRNIPKFRELCSSMPSDDVRQVPHYSDWTPETLNRWNQHEIGRAHV